VRPVTAVGGDFPIVGVILTGRPIYHGTVRRSIVAVARCVVASPGRCGDQDERNGSSDPTGDAFSTEALHQRFFFGAGGDGFTCSAPADSDHAPWSITVSSPTISKSPHYLENPAAQGQLIPDCMVGKSFASVTGCGPATNDDEWEWQARTFAYDNPKCYRPLGTGPWTATLLSPM
jgi:hypothetical protein